MIISDQGVALLSEREGGYRTEAYQDTEGNWTIGCGHTGPEVSAGIVWTLEKCKDVFQKDLSRFEGAINFRVMPTLTQFQFDALVSFTFNVGVGAFQSSTMLKLINQGDMAGAAACP